MKARSKSIKNRENEGRKETRKTKMNEGERERDGGH